MMQIAGLTRGAIPRPRKSSDLSARLGAMEAMQGDEVVGLLRDGDVTRASLLAVVVSPGRGLGLAADGGEWGLKTSEPTAIVRAIEEAVRPRWVMWSQQTAGQLVTDGLRVATCWDVAAVHRLLFGGWKADSARVWAALNGLSGAALPADGQLDFLATGSDDGDPEQPVRPDGHLRPDWVAGGYAHSLDRLGRWASVALQAATAQQLQMTALSCGGNAPATARSESAAELLCAELAFDGLPIDIDRAEQVIAAFIGPRPRSEREASQRRNVRDAAVLAHAPDGDTTDLRNPTQVKSLLMRMGIDLPNTRAWRLEELRSTHPLIDALLTWRKAERMATTYGYGWLDQHVARTPTADGRFRGRLRGEWSASDGAAGRMTAQAGLHNMPADMRVAVAADPGWVFVRADLGQIEPRVLAAVSSDAALARATQEADLYAPVAKRLGVERAVAKVAVLAAMYGQTSGTAGQALRGLESAYPVAMQYLQHAAQAGRDGRDLRTFGGRRIPMWETPFGLSERDERSADASRGRFARNAMVQGAAAELFKAWAVTMRARGGALGATIVLCLHDELLVHVAAEHADQAAALLVSCLDEAAYRWTSGGPVRFVADVSIVGRWSDAKG